MKNHMVPLLLLLISMAIFHACNKPADKPFPCCAPPKGFNLTLSYKTKDGKNLFTHYIENNQIVNSDGPYDTRKIQVYKVINNNNVVTKEPLDSWVKLKEAYGNIIGHSGLSLTLPTEDKRVSGLLICLYPSQETDTLTYKGEGPYNFPKTKNIFYNGICIENLNLREGGGSPPTNFNYYLTLIKTE